MAADLYRPLDYLAMPLSQVYVFADAEPEQRADALMLAFYCAQVLNHGVMVGARQWTDWQWVTRVRIRQAPGADAPGLWQWQGDDLRVLCYDVEYEAKCLARRRGGKTAVTARWGYDADADTSVSTDANTSVCTNAFTDVLQVKESKGKERKNMGVQDKANVVGAAGRVPAPPPVENGGGFRLWLAAMCEAHPSARKSAVLGKDVQAAAAAAFERCPGASSQAELLGAYMADRMERDRWGAKFYRPLGQRRFFEDLEDVLTHAERWSRETGWKPAAARAAKRAKVQAPDLPEEVREAQHERQMQEWERIKQDKEDTEA